jgi:hypothetical protein
MWTNSTPRDTAWVRQHPLASHHLPNGGKQLPRRDGGWQVATNSGMSRRPREVGIAIRAQHQDASHVCVRKALDYLYDRAS